MQLSLPHRSHLNLYFLHFSFENISITISLQTLGVRAAPASILLYGPPGTGKTQLAKAVAGEAQAAYMSIGPSDVLSKFVGESEQSIKVLFEQALDKAKRMESRCTVLFFDEIDALGISRNGGGDNGGGGGGSGSTYSGGENSSRRILAELLIQLSNLSSSCSSDDIDDNDSSDSDDSQPECSYSLGNNNECCGDDGGDRDNDSEHQGGRGEYGNDDGHDRHSRQNENDAESIFRANSCINCPEVRHDLQQQQERHDDVCNQEKETAIHENHVANVDDDIQLHKGISNNGNNPKPRVIVIAATNRPEDCDPALLRRFAIRVLIGLPTHRDRKKIINRLLNGIQHTITPQELNGLSASMEGWSGSDLESITREAVMAPVRECLRSAAIMKMKARKRIDRMMSCDNNSFTSTRSTNGKENCPKDRNCAVGDDIARNELLNGFNNLRPVSIRDFEEAVSFWIGDGQDQMTKQMMTNESGPCHYDSDSSDGD